MSSNAQGNDVMLSIHCGTMLDSARELKKFLVGLGYTVFVCEQMTGGADFRKEICENAAKCRAMIAFMNKRWCDSGECMFEFNIALRVNLTTKKPVLIPLILEDFSVYNDYATISGVFCTFNGIVLKPADLNAAAWDKVAAALRSGNILPQSVPVPAAPAVTPKFPRFTLAPAHEELLVGYWSQNPIPAEISLPAIPPVAALPKQPANLLKPTIFTGTGAKGNRNGDLIFASFESITGMTADERDGSLYVTTLAHTVRKILNGKVSTYAGFQAEQGAADGHVAMATFSAPAGVAVGADGSLYISDALNHKVRRVYSDGNVVSVGGSGEGSRGENVDGYANRVPIGEPGSIAVNKKDNSVYIVDKASSSVRKLLNGTLVTVGGNGKSGYAEGAGAASQFDGPEGLAVLEGDGSVLVADKANNRIRKISADGIASTFAGSGKKGQDDGAANAATFYAPTAITVDPNNGSVYVVDQYGSYIRKISNGAVTSIAALPDATIKALAVYKDVLYVAEAYTIRKITLK